jgi:hypothetical protein
LADSQGFITTEFHDVAACFQPILLFDFRDRGTSERNNKKQNTANLSVRSESELKLKTE